VFLSSLGAFSHILSKLGTKLFSVISFQDNESSTFLKNLLRFSSTAVAFPSISIEPLCPSLQLLEFFIYIYLKYKLHNV
jgi:hypothetical protein